MNGVPLGYHVYAYRSGVLVANTSVQFELDGATVSSGLQPSTSYVFSVCAFNSMGDGPCDATVAVTADSRKKFSRLFVVKKLYPHDLSDKEKIPNI